MFGFSALFGRSREVRRLDAALRAAGLHPALIPDAVKIAALKLLKEDGYGASPDLSACTIAAEMLTYCILGDLGFGEEQGRGAARALEARLEAALAAGDSLDARLILLALHAGIIQGAFAVYSADLLPVVGSLLDGGEARLQELAGAGGVAIVEVEDSAAGLFHSLNTPAEYETLCSSLGEDEA